MCGIFGYAGKLDAAKVVAAGLKRLEYRGYDSWGVAVAHDKLEVYKTVGAVGDVTQEVNLPNAFVGIGHTRWATHGGISDLNAHPHYSTDQKFVLAQNGIVENYQQLRDELSQKGYSFISETDTEVIVRLIEEELKSSEDLANAIRKAFLKLEGRNTILILTDDKEIIAARNGSPLVVGLSSDNEIYLSSDTLSFPSQVEKIIVIDNGQLVRCLDGKVAITEIESGSEVAFTPEDIKSVGDEINKEGYAHFMLKEIYESPNVIKQLISQDMAEYERLSEAIHKADSVYTVASGTAGIAAAQAAFYLRENSKIRATSLIGADAMEYFDFFTENDVMIAPSQSGETADALEVLELAKKKGVKIASYVNMQGSTMTRMSDFKLMAQAGPEICVMSTKVFVSQLAFGYLLSKIVQGKKEEGFENLRLLSEQMSQYLNNEENHSELKALAKKLASAKDIFLLGKYQNFNIVKEGMVKLIEGSYKHAHAIPAGDLKHYAITLMEEGVPVIFAVSEDIAKSDTINAINQVKARGASTIVISSTRHESYDFFLKVPDTKETSAIMNIIPLQLLAYYMTVELGNNVDKPRNIAKSVTVK